MIGYLDYLIGLEVFIVVVVMGVEVIEKYFILDINMEGLDYKVSVIFDILVVLVKGVCIVE